MRVAANENASAASQMSVWCGKQAASPAGRKKIVRVCVKNVVDATKHPTYNFLCMKRGVREAEDY